MKKIEKKAPELSTIYIGNLDYKINEKQLISLFIKFGKIKYVDIVKKNGGRQNKGIAFIKMYGRNNAQRAIKSLNETYYSGRTIKVSMAIESK